MSETRKLYFSKEFADKLLEVCKENFPGYVRGLIVTKDDIYKPNNLYFFKENLRLKNKEIDEYFESFGTYYKKHKGFVADPSEIYTIEKEIEKNNESICGVFHVHIDFPACPTRLDIEMFYQTVIDVDNTWYLIISFLNPETPDVRAFWIRDELINEIKICYK